MATIIPSRTMMMRLPKMTTKSENAGPNAEPDPTKSAMVKVMKDSTAWDRANAPTRRKLTLFEM